MRNSVKTNKKTTATEKNNIVYCNTSALHICPAIDSLYIEWYGNIKKYTPHSDSTITSPKEMRIGKLKTKTDRIIFSCRERTFINKKSVLSSDIYNDIRPMGNNVRTHEFMIYKHTSGMKLLKALKMIDETSDGLNETLLFCFADSDIPLEHPLDIEMISKYLNEKGYKRKIYSDPSEYIENTRIVFYK